MEEVNAQSESDIVQLHEELGVYVMGSDDGNRILELLDCAPKGNSMIQGARRHDNFRNIDGRMRCTRIYENLRVS